MATILDFSILGQLSIIFIFLAIFLGGWGLLLMVNPFKFTERGQNKVYALISFVLAFIVILSPPVVGVIAFSIPWFTVLLICAFFMLFFARMFNPDEDEWMKDIMKSGVAKGFLYFFVGLIVIFAFASAFGQGLLEEQPGISDGDRIAGDNVPVDTFVPLDGPTNTGSSSAPATNPSQGSEFGTVPTDASQRSVASDSIGTNIVLTLFHPKILGMLFMMFLAALTILQIAR